MYYIALSASLFCTQWLQSYDITRTGPVKLLTAGIVPHRIKSSWTNMMLYDLAGHHEYYSSHCAILGTLSLSPSMFLLLVNLLLDLNDITAQLYYWCGMIGDVCHKCPEKSAVIVVGTHADGIADRGKLESLGVAIERVARNAIKKHTFAGYIALNGTALHGREAKRFMSVLNDTNGGVNARCPAISLTSHVTLAFLNDRVPAHLDAIKLSQLMTLLRQEEPKVLPTEASEIIPHLKTLSDKGFIVFLESVVGDSWIVVHPETLLEKVNGVLFAPSFFKEHLPIASNTGVIPLAVLKQRFPEPTSNIDMIVQFLKLFELCIPITLTNVDTNMTVEVSHNTPSNDLGPLLFFPACVKAETPTNAVPLKGLCWQIQTASINQFFSPRCLHVTTSRLADHFALPTVESALVPGMDKFNRSCDVWRSGISWMNEEGTAIVVEMKDGFKCLSCTISTTNNSNPGYLLSVIKVIKETCTEFCPTVEQVDVITYPPEATSENTPGTVELSLLKKIIRSKKNTLVDTTRTKQVMLDKWVGIEPLLSALIGIDAETAAETGLS